MHRKLRGHVCALTHMLSMRWQPPSLPVCVWEIHSRVLWRGVILHSVSPPWLLATLGWSVIHFWEPLHSNYQRGVRGKVSLWDRAVHAALWSSLECFKLRGSHFQLAFYQLHLRWFSTRQLIWHFRKYISWRGFLSKGRCVWGRISAECGQMSFLRGEHQERRAAPPWLSSQPLFFSHVADWNFPHYFPHHLNRSWQQVWAKHNKKGYRWERIKSLSAQGCGIFETLDQLWKTAWR